MGGLKLQEINQVIQTYKQNVATMENSPAKNAEYAGSYELALTYPRGVL